MQLAMNLENVRRFVCVVIVSFVVQHLPGTFADDCASSPCRHGGTCSVTSSGYQCACTPDYTGDHCETHQCINNPCRNNAFCVSCPSDFCLSVTDLGFACICFGGFTGALCGHDINECQQIVGACKNGGTCVNTFGGYNCICMPGYTGPKCERYVPPAVRRSSVIPHISTTTSIRHISSSHSNLPSLHTTSTLYATATSQDISSSIEMSSTVMSTADRLPLLSSTVARSLGYSTSTISAGMETSVMSSHFASSSGTGGTSTVVDSSSGIRSWTDRILTTTPILASSSSLTTTEASSTVQSLPVARSFTSVFQSSTLLRMPPSTLPSSSKAVRFISPSVLASPSPTIILGDSPLVTSVTSEASASSRYLSVSSSVAKRSSSSSLVISEASSTVQSLPVAQSVSSVSQSSTLLRASSSTLSSSSKTVKSISSSVLASPSPTVMSVDSHLVTSATSEESVTSRYLPVPSSLAKRSTIVTTMALNPTSSVIRSAFQTSSVSTHSLWSSPTSDVIYLSSLPSVVVNGVAQSQLTNVNLSFLDPFILLLVFSFVLFLIFIGIILCWKHHKKLKYRTAMDRVSKRLEMSRRETGVNSYAARGPSSTPMIGEIEPDSGAVTTTMFHNPTACLPSYVNLNRRSTIAAISNFDHMPDKAYTRQMTFSGSLRTQKKKERPPIAYEGFWEGHPGEIVYENPAMLEEAINQKQTSSSMLVPDSIRARPPSSVFTIPPPPPPEEEMDPSIPVTPTNSPPAKEAVYEELVLHDPPYNNIGRKMSAVETTIQLGPPQGSHNYYSPEMSSAYPNYNSQGWPT